METTHESHYHAREVFFPGRHDDCVPLATGGSVIHPDGSIEPGQSESNGSTPQQSNRRTGSEPNRSTRPKSCRPTGPQSHRSTESESHGSTWSTTGHSTKATA